MTYEQKYRHNKTLIKNYMDFLQEVTVYDDRLKLITEIGRLCQQQQTIDKMPYKETKQVTDDYPIEVNSIFPTNENNKTQTKPRHQRNERIS